MKAFYIFPESKASVWGEPNEIGMQKRGIAELELFFGNNKNYTASYDYNLNDYYKRYLGVD